MRRPRREGGNPVSEEPRFDVKFSPFAVNEKARCYWDTDLPRKNLEFIRDIDPEYFYYVVQANGTNLGEGSENRAHAAMAVRAAYHHGIETLFALVFAGLQAPDCVIGWVQQYAPGDLRDLVGSVGDKPLRYTRIKPEPFTWEGIAKAVFSSVDDEAANVEEAVELFGRFLSRLAREFLTEQHTDEYNSIKHGLRLTPGATEIRIAFQEEEGKPAPFSQSVPMIQGEYGNTFYVRKVIAKSEGAQHLSLRHSFINWNPKDLCTDLEIISVCIHNVRTWLLIRNGYTEEQLTYKGYKFEVFRERLQTPDISWGSFEPGLMADHISDHRFSEKQVLETYADPTSVP